jgi:hypothetical protein
MQICGWQIKSMMYRRVGNLIFILFFQQNNLSSRKSILEINTSTPLSNHLIILFYTFMVGDCVET